MRMSAMTVSMKMPVIARMVVSVSGIGGMGVGMIMGACLHFILRVGVSGDFARSFCMGSFVGVKMRSSVFVSMEMSLRHSRRVMLMTVIVSRPVTVRMVV